MSYLPKTTALTVAFVFTALGAQADPAALNTPENIAAAMQACAVITAAHDYDAEGQAVDIAWTRITDRSASFGAQDDAVTLSANVWGNGTSGNSYCDFLFTDESLTEAAFDTFMQSNTTVAFEDRPGVCVGDKFILVEMTGPDGPLSGPMQKEGHITVHSQGTSAAAPCTD